MSAVDDRTCGKWMPRAKAYCVRGPDHGGQCASPERIAGWRRRAAARRSDRVITPEDKARWNRAYKFARLGITEEQFNQMLDAQDYACAMCREPFGEEYPQVDHDHSCCPAQPRARAKTCGKCIRGLLCFRCNTALGYIEQYSAMAQAYLGRVTVGDTGIEPVTFSV